MSEADPKRRRLRFSLAAMMAGLTMFCVWLGTTANWVHQRDLALAAERVYFYGNGESPMLEKHVPFSIWLLGARHVETIQLPTHTFSAADAERYRSLFPEANVWLIDNGPRSRPATHK